jgi:hypothetical protein
LTARPSGLGLLRRRSHGTLTRHRVPARSSDAADADGMLADPQGK